MAEAANVLANFFFAFVFTGWWLGELGLAEEPKKQTKQKDKCREKTRETWPDY